MQNKKGFIGLIAMLIVIVIAAIWMVYLFKNNWFGGGIKVPSISENKNEPAQTPQDINSQLDTLRKDVKNIQNQKDKEIFDAMNGK